MHGGNRSREEPIANSDNCDYSYLLQAYGLDSSTNLLDWNNQNVLDFREMISDRIQNGCQYARRANYDFYSIIGRNDARTEYKDIQYSTMFGVAGNDKSEVLLDSILNQSDPPYNVVSII